MSNRVFALFDEAGTGKTKQVIDAADRLNAAGEIDTLLIISPAQCRSVWDNPGVDAATGEPLGELRKHMLSPFELRSVGGRNLAYESPCCESHSWLPRLNIIVTSYETVRRDNRLEEVLKLIAGRKVWIILDESHCIKGHKSLQSKAVLRVRRRPEVRRAVIMTGSSNDNSPLDLFQQFFTLDPNILMFKSWYAFRNRFANLSGPFKKVTGFRDIDKLMDRLRPYVLQRLEEDVVDLPGLDKRTLHVPLGDVAWKHYRSMKRDLVAALDSAAPDSPFAYAKNAAVATTRLLQICAGFLPVEDPETCAETIHDVGGDKLAAAIKWVEDNAFGHDGILWTEPRRLLIWTRFRYELARIANALRDDGAYDVETIEGGQGAAERARAVEAMMSKSALHRPVVCVANAQAGRQGLNLTGCSRVLYVSRDFSLTTAYQSEKRTYRRGQDKRTFYTTLVATGPDGEPTIDGAVDRALREKRDLRAMTIAEFRKAVLGVTQ